MTEHDRQAVRSHVPPRLGKQPSSVGESVNNVVHILLEPADSALLALDMLAEPAQRLELRPAPLPRRRAMVPLLRMYGAIQVLVEVQQLHERLVAQVALEALPIPRRWRRPPARDPSIAPCWPEELLRVGDDPVRVELRDDPVDHLARDTGAAAPGLAMVHECGARDEGLVAALHGTVDRAALVERRALVVPEGVVVFEHALARDAVPVVVSGATVFV